MKRLLLLLVALLLVVGCNSSGGNSTTETVTAPATEPAPTATSVPEPTATPNQIVTPIATVTITSTPSPTPTAAPAKESSTTETFNFQILDRHPDPKLDCINDSMDVFIDVFGVVVMATDSAPLPYVVHTAGVLAQFLDNDEDGVPDEPNVLYKLVEGNYVVPVWSKQEEEEFFQLRTVGSCNSSFNRKRSPVA